MPLTKPYKGENKEDAEKSIARNKARLEDMKKMKNKKQRRY